MPFGHCSSQGTNRLPVPKPLCDPRLSNKFHPHLPPPNHSMKQQRFRAPSVLFAVSCLLIIGKTKACDLCAIYSATNVRRESRAGFLLSMSEQFIAYRTPQFGGKEYQMDDPDYADSSITHFGAYLRFRRAIRPNAESSLRYHSFKRSEVRPSNSSITFSVEGGNESGLGDIALVGRATIFKKKSMKFGAVATLLGGVKFPTGETDRLKDKVEQARIFQSLLPPNYPPMIPSNTRSAEFTNINFLLAQVPLMGDPWSNPEYSLGPVAFQCSDSVLPPIRRRIFLPLWR